MDMKEEQVTDGNSLESGAKVVHVQKSFCPTVNYHLLVSEYARRARRHLETKHGVLTEIFD